MHYCQMHDLVKDTAHVMLSVQLRNSDHFNKRQGGGQKAKDPSVRLLYCSLQKKYEAARWISILSHNHCLHRLCMCVKVKAELHFRANLSYLSLLHLVVVWAWPHECQCLISKKVSLTQPISLWFPQLQLYDRTQFDLFRLNVEEAAYSSIVSYWGNKASRQHSPLFHLQPAS